MEENHRNPYKNNENANTSNNNFIIYLSLVIILLICIINEKSEEIMKKIFSPTVKTLSTGKYTVGTDIVAGLYNLEVKYGTELITDYFIILSHYLYKPFVSKLITLRFIRTNALHYVH